MTTICYYVTGHGRGHAARSTKVIAAFPRDWRVLIQTEAPESLFREELGDRPVTVVPRRFDCGCVQRDSIAVLSRETFALYRRIEMENEARLGEQVAFLQSESVDCVITDIGSFPLRAARAAGVPGVAVSNFTWSDIYAPLAQSDDDRALVARMSAEYGMADRAYVLPYAMPSLHSLFPRSEDVPLVARRGACVRPNLNEWLGGAGSTRLALIYLGVWGIDFDWSRLDDCKNWTFLTYETPPHDVANVRRLDLAMWAYDDVCASVDLVVAKTGYGIVSSCIANRTPLAYVPREGFAEHAVLADALAGEGLGIEISAPDFRSGDWRAAVNRAESLPRSTREVDISGAQVIADKIAELLQGR